MVHKFSTALMLALLFLLIVASASLLVGRYPLSLQDIIRLVSAEHTIEADQTRQILFSLRLPRLLAGLLVGMALAAAGSVYQVMFRNPLVSPDILGVAAGAGFGAIIAIYFNLNIFCIELSAFAFGLLAVLLVCLVATQLKKLDTTLVLILTGVVISSVFGSMISLLKIIADPYTQLATMTFWLMGGLNTVQYDELIYTLPFVFTGLIPVVLLRWRVNLLNLSDEEAESLGIQPNSLRLILIFSATLMTSSVVAISGMIGWVGLIIPHIARLIVGPKFAHVLFLSLILGPLFLVLADTAARVIAPIDLPISILTSFIGAPFFIFLLITKDRRL